MSIGLYIVVIGIISFICGISQIIPKICVLIGLFAMIIGIALSAISEVQMKERIDKLEGKVEELEKQRKEDD